MAKCSNNKKFVDKDIDLLLIGKTGNGKSAIGNSILQRQVFKSSASVASVTTEVDFDYIEFEGRVIKVVDVRGVQDTRETTAKSTALFIREMEYAIVANPKGYHAFLMVLRYSVRFTKEEVETIKFLKAVFGETFVKNHCIIVMAGGDMFYDDHGSQGLTFRNWCDQQTDNSFKELLQECSQRIVLFNNRCKDEDEKKKQLVQLLNLVDQLEGTRYTDDNFKQANATQTKLIMQNEMADIRENALKETSLILQKLKSFQETLFYELSELEHILVRTEALEANLLGVDKKTKLLENFIQNVRAIKATISSEIKVHVDMREWRKTFAENVKNMEQIVALKKYKLTKKFSLLMAKCYDNRDGKRKLEEDLDKKIKELDDNLEKEKNDMESEFQNEIQRRRQKLKSDRICLEGKYEEIKYSYIFYLLNSLFKILIFPFEKILSKFRNMFKRENVQLSLF